MLVEIANARTDHEPGRRWFTSEQLDLIVWMDPDSSVGAFQLCYDKNGDENAVTWSRKEGYSHHRVDSGERSPTKNQTPILEAGGEFSKERVAAEFSAAAANLEFSLRSFIVERLRACP